MRKIGSLLSALLAIALAATVFPQGGSPVPQAQRLKHRTLATKGHDVTIFTQGLEYHDGVLFQSAGQYGESRLIATDFASGQAMREVVLESQYFAEGITKVGENIFMLTWQEGTAFVYNAETFDLVRTHSYGGEGWGLCYDGKHLIMSNGSANLIFIEPETFKEVRSVLVQESGRRQPKLNELEFVDGFVYANIFESAEIVKIDPATGDIVARIDCRGILPRSDVHPRMSVMNGIAYDPVRKRFLLTGKYWPRLFEVEFVPATGP